MGPNKRVKGGCEEIMQDRKRKIEREKERGERGWVKERVKKKVKCIRKTLAARMKLHQTVCSWDLACAHTNKSHIKYEKWQD